LNPIEVRDVIDTVLEALEMRSNPGASVTLFWLRLQ
jgi:hypothetical protein